MDVVVEKVPWHYQDSEKEKKTKRDIGHKEDVVEWSNERCEEIE
jgi:hypothetical protein